MKVSSITPSVVTFKGSDSNPHIRPRANKALEAALFGALAIGAGTGCPIDDSKTDPNKVESIPPQEKGGAGGNGGNVNPTGGVGGDTDTFTATKTTSSTATDSNTATKTTTLTGTATGSNTATGTANPTGTNTGSSTGTTSATATDSNTATKTTTSVGTDTVTGSNTATGTNTGSVTSTTSATGTNTGSVTNTTSATETNTGSVTNTTSATATDSNTATKTTTLTDTSSVTKTATETATTPAEIFAEKLEKAGFLPAGTKTPPTKWSWHDIGSDNYVTQTLKAQTSDSLLYNVDARDWQGNLVANVDFSYGTDKNGNFITTKIINGQPSIPDIITNETKDGRNYLVFSNPLNTSSEAWSTDSKGNIEIFEKSATGEFRKIEFLGMEDVKVSFDALASRMKNAAHGVLGGKLNIVTSDANGGTVARIMDNAPTFANNLFRRMGKAGKVALASAV